MTEHGGTCGKAAYSKNDPQRPYCRLNALFDHAHGQNLAYPCSQKGTSQRPGCNNGAGRYGMTRAKQRNQACNESYRPGANETGPAAGYEADADNKEFLLAAMPVRRRSYKLGPDDR